VFEDPHLAWGLPLGYFSPQALLNHLLARLTPGGLLLIVNQGEAEWTRQGDLLAQAAAGRAQPGKFSFQSVGQLPASFIEYRYPRWGWLCVRERA
ncbi:hypothetical protein, partial [Salmonella enterica]|uniref:hypothetical protein n=1 Tax=Salmonella enterica TaxID=28901 RepID=UPI003D2948EC